MISALLIGTGAFAGAFVYCSFFEWALHRYIMHSERWMKYAYRTHQLQHHEIFKADETYFFENEPHVEDDMEHVTFAWWNAPLLIGLHLPLFGGMYWLAGWPAVGGTFAAMAGYYALYEYFHYCMHVPGDRFFEKTRIFAFVQTHHRLHHVYYLKNLNVVVPIADFVLRTRVALTDSSLFEKMERVRLERDARAADPGAAA